MKDCIIISHFLRKKYNQVISGSIYLNYITEMFTTHIELHEVFVVSGIALHVYCFA